MTKERAAKLAEVLKAYSESKPIQYRSYLPGNDAWTDWKDYTTNITFDEYNSFGQRLDYRVKPILDRDLLIKYNLLKELEEYYWDIFIKRHSNPDDYSLESRAAYQNVWNNMYDMFNSVARKLEYPGINRTF